MSAGLMDAQSSGASPSDLLQDLAKHRFQALEEHFQALTTTLNHRMDGMGARLQALQKDVDELMLQAGVEDSAQEPQTMEAKLPQQDYETVQENHARPSWLLLCLMKVQ